MRDLKEFKINFVNLKPGNHSFSFDIDAAFFENFENTLIEKASATINLSLEKQDDTLLILSFKGKGIFELECDRCLDEFSKPFQLDEKIFVRITDNPKFSSSEDEELIVIPSSEYELNLAPILYEYIHLQIPIKKICEDVSKTCNPEMIEKISQYIIGSGDTSPEMDEGQEMESEFGLNQDEQSLDPRWIALKKLIPKNEEFKKEDKIETSDENQDFQEK